MTQFIALRRQSRSRASDRLSVLSFEEKRAAIAQEAPVSEHTDSLKGLGLAAVEEKPPTAPTANSFQRLGYVGAYVVDAEDETVAHQAAETLENDYMIIPNIELALPQPSVAQRYGRRPVRKERWPAESGVGEAHKNGVAGAGVLVGVLDTGCDADHIELRRKRIEYRYVPLDPTPDAMRACEGFDVDGHGTHVTGIIAGENVGVAPDVDLMVAAVIESETHRTSLQRIMVALNWMLSQFQDEANLSKPTIINMSLGFLPEWISAPNLQTVINGVRLLLTTLVDDFDVLPVIAIGNDGLGRMRAPGYFPESLSVGALDFECNVADFSGGGLSPITNDPVPLIAGYGVDVLSSLERNIDRRSIYANLSGTSMATPYVTGIAALTASANPGLHGPDLRKRLLDDALKLDAPANRVGAGLARFIL